MRLLRWRRRIPKDPPSRFAQSAEMNAALKRTLETIAMAKVSTSAAEARGLGLLTPSDRITLNRERLLLDAKALAAALAEAGYTAPQPRERRFPRRGSRRWLRSRRAFTDGRGGLRFGARPEGGALGGIHSVRRTRDGGYC